MTRYVCPDCNGDLVQMLEREPWGTPYEHTKTQSQNSSKHYGFYCKACTRMFKEKMSLVPDGEQE